MGICIIFNPTARGDKAKGFRAWLERIKGECVLRPTTGPGHATPLAAEAVAAGFDTIVAAGGDGTVNEVVNGLAAVDAGLDRARLGVLPLGTVNVFAKELGLSEDLGLAWGTILRGQDKRFDLPLAEFTAQGECRRRWFTQMAGAGLDSRAVAAVDWEWKKRVGPLAYIKAGLEAMRGAQPLVIARGNDWEANGELVLIGNGRFYGGRVPIFPMASMDDGALDVRVFPRVNMLSLARFGWAWLVERPLSQRGDRFFRADRVTLASTSPVPFELDGDNAGMLPATLTVRRSALRAIVAC